jgi:hypothetical protein
VRCPRALAGQAHARAPLRAPADCGDSLLGYKAHFGCGSLTANLPLLGDSKPSVDIGERRYMLGRKKVGAVVGDHVQLGWCACACTRDARGVRDPSGGSPAPKPCTYASTACLCARVPFKPLDSGTVTEPGCLLAPRTLCYPLTRLARGCYGPNELLKNRPTIERVPLRRDAP